jgi:hypothetical protein
MNQQPAGIMIKFMMEAGNKQRQLLLLLQN